MIGFVIILGIVGYWVLMNERASVRAAAYELPEDAHEILEDEVRFYRNLDEAGKTQFRARVKDFLAHTSIRGINTEVDDTDRLLVAAGAIIPIFAFPDWRYNNIAEVLIYPDAFTRDFRASGSGRNVAGMVGDGAMNRQMILSQRAVRASFSNSSDGNNTVIHEFVHLLDKADGSTDGIPEYLLSQPAVIPWVRMVEQRIMEIRGRNPDRIDPYAGTNEAEFFAVIAEYFFERPEMLRQKDPELYAMLEGMFRTGVKRRQSRR